MDPRLCVLCRGAKRLCGRSYCPILVELSVFPRIVSVYSSKEVYGSTPPSVYVGYTRYPRVWIAIGIPPEIGDTRIYDYPEAWSSLPIDKVLEYRLSMVMAGTHIDAHDVKSRIVETVQEVAIYLSSSDVEAILRSRPRYRPRLSDFEPPTAIHAKVDDIRVVSTRGSMKAVENAVSDTDAKAVHMIIELYWKGVPVSHIQKLLSVGLLGKKTERRLVPTRWAITAVDYTISKHLVEKIRSFETIDRVELRMLKKPGNLFIALLIPGSWSFEWMEAWFPGSVWNPHGTEPIVEGDFEVHRVKQEVNIGGCYHAARLAVAEHLYARKRQAIAILWREIYEGFNIPIGVWFVRECVRELMKMRPLVFSNVEEALKEISRVSRLGVDRWVSRSGLLKIVTRTRRLTQFIKIVRDFDTSPYR